LNTIKKISFLPIVFLLITNLMAETTGMGFLTMPGSAKSAATMSVFGAEFTDAANLFDNPIGIATDKTNINFSSNFWFADINQSLLTFGTNTKYGTLGMGLNFVKAPGFEVRTHPTDEPEGEINAQFLMGAVGFTREMIRRVYVGVNAKYLHQSMYTESANGFAMDLSAMWKMPSNLNLTVALQNLGKMSKLRDEATTLPNTLKFGLVRPDIMGKSSPLNASLGIYFDQNIKAETTKIKVGGELIVYEKLALRGGYSIEEQYNNSSFGVGLNLNKFNFDFAMLIMEEIPDYPYMFTFSYDL